MSLQSDSNLTCEHYILIAEPHLVYPLMRVWRDPFFNRKILVCVCPSWNWWTKLYSRWSGAHCSGSNYHRKHRSVWIAVLQLTCTLMGEPALASQLWHYKPTSEHRAKASADVNGHISTSLPQRSYRGSTLLPDLRNTHLGSSQQQISPITMVHKWKSLKAARSHII